MELRNGASLNFDGVNTGISTQQVIGDNSANIVIRDSQSFKLQDSPDIVPIPFSFLSTQNSSLQLPHRINCAGVHLNLLGNLYYMYINFL